MVDYRQLSEDEIEKLKLNSCTAEDWSRVLVAQDFLCERLAGVRFSGDIKLGNMHGHIDLVSFESPCGISNAALHNCTIAGKVIISNIGRFIADYDIADDVVIQNVGCIANEDKTPFGNGCAVSVVVESGGREILMFDRLSSHLAYIMAFYRHRSEVIELLEGMIQRYAEEIDCTRGSIDSGARIIDVGSMYSVRVGACAWVHGAMRLRNGTIGSSPDHPTHVGEGVIAQDFIFCSGSDIDSGANVEKVFLGQGALLKKQFVAENSLFFANSEGYMGEACSVFAGPYTVTHHKSSMLLTALYSFYNAGSGTNFSNHLYKLGPIHQGILERGCKTGSSSYICWPGRVGAFSAVIGHHYHGFDTSTLPFSYLFEKDGETIVLPGGNLFTVGTSRDIAKWPNRDRRKDSDILDLIHFEALSPYTVQKMIAARGLLAAIAEKGSGEMIKYCGTLIPRSRIQRACDDYALAISCYIGGCLVRCAEDVDDPEKIIVTLLAMGIKKCDGWIDLCGMLCPKAKVEELLENIETGKVGELNEIEAELVAIHKGYPTMENSWVLYAWLRENGKNAATLNTDDLAELVVRWRDASLECNKRILGDARKEFNAIARTSFGIDSTQSAEEDFKQVRGTYEDNPFVKQITKESETVCTRADKLLARLK